MGNKALSKVQLGLEATQGTAVAADFIWRGPFAGLKDARTTNLVEENIGIALPSSMSYASGEMAEWSQPVTQFTPELAPHIFEAGIKQVGTGVADGDSSGYLYSYPFGTTSLNTVQTYTIETGDEDQAEEAEFCFVKSFTITGTPGEALSISSEWAGRRVADSTFTSIGGGGVIDVSYIHSTTGSLWIDNNSSSFGTTAVSAGNLMEMTLSVTTGQTALFTIDSGQLYFSGIYFNSDDFEATLELKFIHNSTTHAEKTAWRANTQRLVRLEFTGDAYGTPGTTGDFTTKALRIDFPGAWTDFTSIEHDEGKSIISGTLSGGYDTVSQDVLTLVVANELATLTGV